MKLAFISPTNALKKISVLGDIEFCLAPHALRDKKYKQYFIDAKKKGRYVIIDNGVAEGDLISNDKLVNLAIEMKVAEIIVPDKIGDLQTTQQLRETFLKKYYYILKKKGIKIQSVIQGKTIFDYISDFAELCNSAFIDVVGIPFRMEYAKFNSNIDNDYYNHGVNRIMFLYMLKGQLKKEIHLLGCNLPADMLSECPIKIRSMDSKLMARYGLNEMIWDKNDADKPKKKLYITDKMTRRQISCAVKNIKKLKECMK